MSGPRDFGWWIESVDEEVYGPVSRATLSRFLEEGVISANTATRHCCSATAAPLVDQGILDDVDWSAVKRSGDTLGESWPRRKKDRLALAESEIECSRHRRPALQTCIRCLAPYCQKCQMPVKRGKTYYMCKKCQSGIFNRRFVAFMGDSLLIQTVPLIAASVVLAAVARAQGAAAANVMILYGINIVMLVVFFLRDAIMGGAGPMKRLLGLRVVKSEDGESPLSYGQGLMRWIAHLIPIFGLFDASRAYSDPLGRRYGDGWAKTRVRETAAKVDKARAKVRRSLSKKNIEFETDGQQIMSLEEFARLDQ